MKFGLAVNANETMPEIVRKSVEAERLGIDYVWVPDAPVQLYAPAVASAIADSTRKVRIGLGLLSVFLHTPVQIVNSVSTLVETYGERFELCVGPGDRNLLKNVGMSLHHPMGVANYVLEAGNQIQKTLRKSRIKCRTWLGAQGPKMLETSKFFDGVLLNYAHPKLVKWAVGRIGRVKRKDFKLGVFSASYVYSDLDPKIQNLLRFASATVALGASKSVLKSLNLLAEVSEAKSKLDSGSSITSISDQILSKATELFSISMPFAKLGTYLSDVSKMKVEHVVFGYPQNFSLKTIRNLAHALNSYTRLKRSPQTRKS